MFEQDNIFVDSRQIRFEYTYFVCFSMLPEHNQYFNRPTYQSSSASAASFRDTITHRSTYNNKRAGGHKKKSDRSSAFDAQSMVSLDQRQPRKAKGNRAMQAMRDSIDTESVKFS